ncbi:laccase, multicopper oxidase, benzenediol:oxygen oxidorectuctase [Friedmanniomyces endolithicus]|nr:laccase, multicopper oxidase, benzenediol:oxygen oxidorectuctase [Friedmanniomyces endolithicus]
MRFNQIAGACLAACTALTTAAVVPAEPIEKRATSTTSRVADAACTNGPNTRACWKNGYSIATDFDQKFPTTGNTVTQNLEITNGTCNPDGHGSRLCLLINGQYPGPTIRATWGDMLSITVKNSMQDNGTSLHWHGVRQYHSPGSDGVNGITECPLAPGQTRTYTFQVTQYSTSWYHAHFSSQYGDGVIGPIVFDGPASANYDEDLGPYILNEWYYQTSYQINAIASVNLGNGGPPPNADNMLINGTNKNANGGGSYNQVKITSGKKYRLRLINMSVDNYIRVSLDGHAMQVMTTDFIPCKPFSVNSLLLGIGQRYDVVINANQTAGNYWFRANVANDCLSGNNFYGRAIWSYSSVTPGTPTTSANTQDSVCLEPSQAAPYWVQPVPSGSFASQIDALDVGLTKAQVVPNGDAIIVWAINTSSINVAWDHPTLQYVMEGNTSYPTQFNVVPTVNEGAWNYVVVQMLPNNPPVPHPFHLHGHDFFLLGQGSGTFSAGSASLNFATPPRRDTATVPGGGWLAIAFNSNNPGTWLMHCHIAWHVSEGLGVQFLESPSQITLPDKSQFDSQCSAWNKYYQTAYWKKDDSGI